MTSLGRNQRAMTSLGIEILTQKASCWAWWCLDVYLATSKAGGKSERRASEVQVFVAKRMQLTLDLGV